jgi:predicted DNA-binding transcriptional regulator AlpA
VKSSRSQSAPTELWPAEGARGLVTLRQVAAYVRCSPKHLLRLVDRGDAPEAIRLGALLRWPQSAIEEWVAAGCPRHQARAAREDGRR